MRRNVSWKSQESVMRQIFWRVATRGALVACFVASFITAVSAGPYAPAAGVPGSDAVAANSSSIVEWANAVTTLTRGPQNVANPSLGLASFGAATAAVGPADNSVVSLGDGGSITVSFAQPITNGAGADFAVYENGFMTGSQSYLELGFVEVSSNGANFFRFPSVSLTPSTTQTGSFGFTDPTNLYDLAGKYVALQGTPFDLAELAGVSPLLNVNDVRYVRVVDVVGSINPGYATHDSLGNLINDPWPTAFASSGFDFDAVGVMHAVPEPGTIMLFGLGMLLFWLRSTWRGQ
jgi:hypothetical protein